MVCCQGGTLHLLRPQTCAQALQQLVQLVTGALLLIVITIEFLAGRLALGNTVFGRAIPKAGARRPAAGGG